MKYFFSIIIGFSFFMPYTSVYAQNFSDVSNLHKHKEAISALSGQGVVSGYSDGTFKPGDSINRAEAIKILIGATVDSKRLGQALLYHQQNQHTYVRFPDVKMADWFSPYVEIGFNKKIIKGHPDGNFHPGDKINFAEALKIILESYEADIQSLPFVKRDLLYTQSSDWFYPYFEYAYQNHLINPEKFYHPAQLITRGEFAEIIYRLQNVSESGTPFSIVDLQDSDEYTLTIPRLNIVNVNVNFADPYNETQALDVLKGGFGHYLSAPGTGRKSVLFGHSSGYSWDNSSYKELLRSIDQVGKGDDIFINYKENGYHYQVYKTAIITAKEDYKLMENQDQNEIDIYTCWPPDHISHRYVLYTKPVN